ncbi:MAG: creatininase family protein [Phycisphaerae bacterium]|jgi:creatinine amidohydrolase/Fe(II)-dependent formamide hydrolase-like protein|nr:creatininase family protein [Phycisphaerae bacterium]
MQKVKWEEMFPDELLEAIEACPVCYMAYGLAEPHGTYNAIGLDWLKAYALCQRAAHEHGGVVAPPFCWHIQEQPWFDWTTLQGVKQSLCSTIPADLFLRMVFHQLRVFDARGFKAAILITGHYGGFERDMRMVCEYYRHRSGSPLQTYCIADWECIDYENYHGDHAGMCETQQLMALRPELVDISHPDPSPKSGRWVGTDFAKIGKTPTPEVGEKIVASQIENLGSVHKQLLADYRPVEGWAVPNQTEADEMWHTFERVTRKYWVSSNCVKEFGDGPPEFPGWEELGL